MHCNDTCLEVKRIYDSLAGIPVKFGYVEIFSFSIIRINFNQMISFLIIIIGVICSKVWFNLMLSIHKSSAFFSSLWSCIFIYFVFITQTRIPTISARFAHWSCWSAYVHIISNEWYDLCIITCSFDSIPCFSIHLCGIFRWCTSNCIW